MLYFIRFILNNPKVFLVIGFCRIAFYIFIAYSRTNIYYFILLLLLQIVALFIYYKSLYVVQNWINNNAYKFETQKGEWVYRYNFISKNYQYENTHGLSNLLKIIFFHIAILLVFQLSPLKMIYDYLTKK